MNHQIIKKSAYLNHVHQHKVLEMEIVKRAKKDMALTYVLQNANSAKITYILDVIDVIETIEDVILEINLMLLWKLSMIIIISVKNFYMVK